MWIMERGRKVIAAGAFQVGSLDPSNKEFVVSDIACLAGMNDSVDIDPLPSIDVIDPNLHTVLHCGEAPECDIATGPGQNRNEWNAGTAARALLAF